MTAFPNRKDKIKFVPSMLLKMLMAPRIWWMLSHKLVAQVIFIYSTAAFLNLNCLVCHIQPVYKLDRIIQNTGYEARTPLRGGVSRCPTRVGVRHLYDTRTTPVGIVKQVSPKK
jgi:hypothetical protein